jgi:pSer/pThr/pTyr-binding forkhead associated (FHA) protein
MPLEPMPLEPMPLEPMMGGPVEDVPLAGVVQAEPYVGETAPIMAEVSPMPPETTPMAAPVMPEPFEPMPEMPVAEPTAPPPVAEVPPPAPAPAPEPMPPPAPAPAAEAPQAPAAAPAAPVAAGAAIPTGAQVRLLVIRGQKRNVEYPVYDGLNFIGRADEKPVDIDLEDQEPPDRIWSSRQHAVLELGDGKLTIEDLNSSNGTFVNRGRIYPGQKQPLGVNDVIQIGTVQLRVVV